MASKGRPLKKIEDWPFAPPPLGAPGTARERTRKLVEVLTQAGDGSLALVLARARWPLLWDGPSERFTPKQREAQDSARREVVELWVRTHARNLDWHMATLGVRGKIRRKAMKATATAHEKAAHHIRCWANDPSSADTAHRAIAALDALPDDQILLSVSDLRPDPKKVTGETIHEASALASKILADGENIMRHRVLMERMLSHAGECDRVVQDIKVWLHDNDAKGGTNLAARAIAQIVAQFFDDAHAKAARAASGTYEELPKVVFRRRRRMTKNIPDGHLPCSDYCRVVEAALIVSGATAGSWQQAAKAICKKRNSEIDTDA